MSKEEKIERAMRLVWDSLESHLPHTYGQRECVRCKAKLCKCDNSKFHKKTIKEYVELLTILSELL